MMWLLLKLVFYFLLFFVGAGVLLKIYTLLTIKRYKIKKSLKGKVVVITGGTAGIGKETVRELAAHGATVHVLARDLIKAERVIGEIKQSTGNNDITIHQADLTKFSTIRDFAKRFLDTKSPLHILINNAGMATGSKRITVDGNEETTQTNHLSHFLLTNLLLDRLIQSGPSRIVNVSSLAHAYVNQKRFDVHDINFQKPTNKWHGFVSYAWSKLMNLMFTRELALRLHGKNVTVNCLHPGAVRTEITREGTWKDIPVMLMRCAGPFLKTSYEGAQTTLYLATADEVEHVSGHYFSNCKLDGINLLAADDQLCAELWKESERLTGLTKQE